jgi:hypothetical protein
MGSFFDFLGKLIQPGNWPFLAVFAVVLVGAAVFLIFWVVAYVKKEKLNISHRFFGRLWIHITGGPDDPKTQPRRYRKLLYVKVNLLSNQKAQAAPFYQRKVARLDGSDRVVPVYDEAVYYTLKLFPEKQTVIKEQDQSSGVVDPRLVIPWTSRPELQHSMQPVKQLVDIESSENSDTMLSISHFLNGFQTADTNLCRSLDNDSESGDTEALHGFCTYADEDAESLRLVVDFSSIPNARALIPMPKVKVMVGGQIVDMGDDLKYEQCGESVYMALCKDAKKGTLLVMCFAFKNWDGTDSGPAFGRG